MVDSNAANAQKDVVTPIPMMQVLILIASLGFVTSTVYLVLVTVAAIRFRKQSREFSATSTQAAILPPVSLLKPLHGMEPHLRENLESFFCQDYPRYEIIFGVRSDSDPALGVVQELARSYSRIPIKIVVSGEPQWPNAKICNLDRMLSEARHNMLVISDSDVRVSRDYVSRVTAPLANPVVGMVTCIYRGVNTGGLWSRLEAMGMSVELTSGVLVANMMEGMKFALGPTMATRRECLERIGGLRSAADYLADDFVLGNRISAAGYQVLLSDYIVEHVVLNRSFLTSLQHQVRWAKSTRLSRPRGHIGSGLTFAIPFGVIALIAAKGPFVEMVAFALFAAAMANRALLCVIVGWGVVRDEQARRCWWLYPIRDLLGFAYWAASFLASSRTVWRGDRYRLEAGGRMIREASPTSR